MAILPSVQEALSISECRYRRLFETAQDGILILDGKSGAIVDVNPYLLFLLGYPYEAFIGKRLWEIGAFRDVDENKGRFQALVENDYIQYNDLPLITKDGREIAVEFVSNVYIVDGAMTIQCNIRDISARKKAERLLHEKEVTREESNRQMQRLESLSTLAGGVAHEFNNVLAMILPSAEMIAATAEITSKTSVHAKRIVEAALRGADIVKQLSIFAHSEESELKPISLQRIVLDIGALLGHTITRDITVRTEIFAENSLVFGDYRMLHQAVVNLSINAVDAMPNGGTLTLALVDADDEEIGRIDDEITKRTGTQRFVALIVQDTGVGIGHGAMERIFDPFFTTKEHGKGAGLGLSIVYGIVKNHHGYHRIESIPEGGTRVSLYFPLGEAAEVPGVQTAAAAHGSTGETILILDDEEEIRQTLCELLSNHGYTVIAASNGLEGMEQLRVHHESIKLVITDLGMPKMNGEEFFMQAKVFKPKLKTIITTGYVNVTTASKLLSLGVADMLMKTFSVHTLLPAVRRALEAA